eukprot:TRINITY_DN7628_c0_g2_i3.p1 TRINITY_DN7628_c0_g2~~TRINITY_DN7628_c0_g2_i3.p1  ORF type:complete len:1609 (-),score=218.49 TRINITY_DN7628_c0_g2_i3:341-5167(-)
MIDSDFVSFDSSDKPRMAVPMCNFSLGTFQPGDLYQDLLTYVPWDKLHWSTQQAFQVTDHEAHLRALHGPPESIYVFTDGSFQQVDGSDDSAWSMVVITHRPDLSSHSPSCGFAFAGYACGRMQPDRRHSVFTGADEHSIEGAETYALASAAHYLFHAALDGVQQGFIFSDSTCALSHSSGTSQKNRDSSQRIVVAASHWLQRARERLPVDVRHIHGHLNHPWNEMADTLAHESIVQDWATDEMHNDAIMYHIVNSGHLHKWQHLLDEDLDPIRRGMYPQFNDQGLYFKVPHTVRRDLLESNAGSEEARTMTAAPAPAAIDICLNVCTMNVLSLLDRDRRPAEVGLNVGGRMAAIMQQCVEENLNIVGVQEARMPSGYINTSSFHVFSTASQNGNYGCQCWISKILPGPDGSNIKVKLRDVHVNYQDSRRLLLALRVKGHNYNIAVLHAPVAGSYQQPCEAYTDWWKTTQELLLNRFRQGKLIVLADTNCNTFRQRDVVGDLGTTDAPNACTDIIANLLVKCNLWEPASYHGIHSGDSHTFEHVKGTLHRIDHIFVSNTIAGTMQSRHADVDVSMQRVDHIPLMLSFKTTQPASHAEYHAKRRLNPNAFNDSDTISMIEADIKKMQLPQWHVEPTSHYCCLADQLQQILRTHASTTRRPPAPWMSDGTHRLTRYKADLRKQQRDLSRQANTLRLSIALAAWRGARSHEQHGLPAANGRRTLDMDMRAFHHWLAVIEGKVVHTSKRIQEAVRHDKKVFRDKALDDMNDNMNQHQMKQAVKKLKLLAPYRARPLPFAGNSSATLTPDEAAQALLDFANDKFGGETISSADHYQTTIRAYLHRQALADNYDEATQCPIAFDASDIDLDIIPSQAELTACFASIRPHKAGGPDGLPSALFHALPATLARVMHPIAVKSMLLCEEPATWALSKLVMIPKPRAPSTNPAHMRGIHLSCCTAKAVHALLRPKLESALSQKTNKHMFGGMKSRTSAYATHMIKLANVIAHHENKSSATIFVDLEAAFDSVERSQIFVKAADDHRSRQLLHDLQLDGSNDADTRDLGTPLFPCANGGNMLSRLGISCHIQRYLWQLLSNTTLVHDASTKLTRYGKGTKQGDPLSDVLFMVVYEAALSLINRVIGREGLRLQLNGNAQHLLACEGGLNAQLGDVSFVDDQAQHIVHASAEGLLEAIPYILSMMHKIFTAMHFKPNYKPGKSEVQVSLRAKHATRLLREMDIQRDEQGATYPAISFSTDSGLIHIKVSKQYLHLGSVLDHMQSHVPDIRRRSNIMIGKMQVCKKAIHSWRICSHHRARLVNMIGYPSYFHHGHLWTNLQHREATMVQHGMHRVYKWMGDDFRCSHDSIKAQPYYRDGLHVLTRQRLLYFASLHSAPSALRLALAKVHHIAQSVDAKELVRRHDFYNQVQLDIAWLQQYGSKVPDHSHLDVAFWFDYAANRSRWKRLLRQAEFNANTETQQQACDRLQQIQDGAALDSIRTEYEEEQLEYTHSCDKCARRFKSAAALMGHGNPGPGVQRRCPSSTGFWVCTARSSTRRLQRPAVNSAPFNRSCDEPARGVCGLDDAWEAGCVMANILERRHSDDYRYANGFVMFTLGNDI